MTHVGRGSRLTVRVGDRSHPVRALADLELAGDWTLPVLALAAGIGDQPGHLEITTEQGVLRLPVRLVHGGRGLVLTRAGASPSGTETGLDAAVVPVQRRADVRGAVALPLRAAVLTGRGQPDVADVAFHGATLTVSAGGASLAPQGPGSVELPCGARLFLELELPDGTLVPAVLGVLAPGGTGVRGPFMDIAAADRERLVRLVFAEQRRQLVARRHLRR
jgi:hypothetical protein